jgi:hypothetical protein
MFGRIGLQLVLALGCVAACLVPGDAVAQIGDVAHTGDLGSTSTAAQSQLLVSDMSKPSEELPQGVPGWYDWASHPRTHQLSPPGSFRAFTAWGQLYQCAGAPATPAATVDLRDMQAWVLLRSSGRWRRIQLSSDLGGAAFPENYVGPTVAGRYSASSTVTFAQLVSGHNFHFWPHAGRVSVNASDVAAVTVGLEARLGQTPAHAPTPCLVLSVGGDMWRSLTVSSGGSASADVGIGRFKRVEDRWRLFTMTTAPASLLQRSPVPPMSPAAADF